MNPFFKRSENHQELIFNVFGVPHNPSHDYFSCCAFAQKTVKLCWILKSLGCKVRHFGNELSDVFCDEHISVTSEAQLLEAYPNCREQLGHVDYLNPSNPEAIQYLNELWTLNTAYEVKKRYDPGDYFCYVTPTIQRDLYSSLVSLPVHHVETGVGYMGAYLPYRIFESPGIQAWHYGFYASNFEKTNKMEEMEKSIYSSTATPEVPQALSTSPPQNTLKVAYQNLFPFDPNTHIAVYDVPKLDAVIPNSFFVSQFDFKIGKDDYFLFLGRLIAQKGLLKAIEITKKLGKKLVIAGPGDFQKEFGMSPPSHVEILGPVGPDLRRELLANAIALLCISDYWEPFGGVHIEAMLSGTPPIGSDRGGFTHTIRSGYNGYRVGLNEVEQGIWACMNVDKIDPYALRDFGLRFSNEQIALRYDEYFQSLERAIHNNGDLNAVENSYRENLDWLDYDRKIEWLDGWMVPVDHRG